ncbi:hypothetical protein LMG31884_46450 (plasmid) [Xanthomonas hydrangeae]|nr:hypothetical protein LMG31884_46450 [Xanthomonas hydrangeae]CAD7740269.1 hypothetical protein LMG31884_46450 [Xanthomonas hydrangeae]
MDHRRRRRLQEAWSPSGAGLLRRHATVASCRPRAAERGGVGHLVWITAGGGVCRRPGRFWCGSAALAQHGGQLQAACGRTGRIGHLVWITASGGVCRRPGRFWCGSAAPACHGGQLQAARGRTGRGRPPGVDHRRRRRLQAAWSPSGAGLLRRHAMVASCRSRAAERSIGHLVWITASGGVCRRPGRFWCGSAALAQHGGQLQAACGRTEHRAPGVDHCQRRRLQAAWSLLVRVCCAGTARWPAAGRVRPNGAYRAPGVDHRRRRRLQAAWSPSDAGLLRRHAMVASCRSRAAERSIGHLVWITASGGVCRRPGRFWCGSAAPACHGGQLQAACGRTEHRAPGVDHCQRRRLQAAWSLLVRVCCAGMPRWPAAGRVLGPGARCESKKKPRCAGLGRTAFISPLQQQLARSQGCAALESRAHGSEWLRLELDVSELHQPPQSPVCSVPLPEGR